MPSPLYRELFGPSREQIWRELSPEIGATYVDGGFWKGYKVQATHGEWQISPDRQGPWHASACSLCESRWLSFHSLSQMSLFSELGKYLGMQDVVVDHADFDRDFVIQGTDETKLRQLFGNARIRELVAAQPQIHFSVQPAPGIFSRDLFADQPPKRRQRAGIPDYWHHPREGTIASLFRALRRSPRRTLQNGLGL